MGRAKAGHGDVIYGVFCLVRVALYCTIESAPDGLAGFRSGHGSTFLFISSKDAPAEKEQVL